jgi:subtilisin family serine protease
MKKLSRLFLFAFAATLLMAGYSPSASSRQETGYIPGEILVKYRPHISETRIGEIESKWGFRTKRVFRRFGIRHVSLPRGMSVEEATAILSRNPHVEYAEPNFCRRPQETTPDDPSFVRLWGLKNTGQFVNGRFGTPGADIDATGAWDNFRGSSGIIIAVVDTGVDYTHPDLAANIWTNTGEIPGNGDDDDGNGYIDDVHGWDFYANDNDPADEDGHGTHVSGTIAAVGNNGIGVSGVCWQAQIMPLRFMDETGSISDEIAAIDYAIKKGAKVINMSFGDYWFSLSEREAILRADKEGILCIAAAGNEKNNNDGSKALYPASYDLANIISVAATDQDDELWDYSNYGATSVDVGAPGVNIYSTSPGSGYSYKNGTSMATPHAAGVAALLWGFDPGLTHAQVSDTILESTDPLPSLIGRTVTGGRINAYNVLTYELPDPPQAPSGLGASAVSSSAIDLSWTDGSDNERGFVIERKDGAEGTYAAVANPGADTTTYADTGLDEGTFYGYRISAVNAGGASGYSNEAGDTTYPATPSRLSAETVTSSGTTLTWRDNSSSEEGFSIERMAPGGTYEEISRVNADVTSYSDTGLSQFTTYYYRVRSYRSGDYSAYSETANVTTKMAAPTGMSATAISETEIDLVWSDNSNDEEGFIIERKAGVSGTYGETGRVPANAEAYSDTGLAPGTTYYYRVSAFAADDTSDYSNEPHATTVGAEGDSVGGGGGGGGCFVTSAISP